MKKHIISFLIFSMFAGASAQNYTQAFDSVFQHVDLSHTSTGILYERVLPISTIFNLSVRFGLEQLQQYSL